jgi:hypothetical protein
MANVMTVFEQAKRLDPNGAPAKIAEILDKDNTFFKDAPAIQANDQFSHLYTVRAALGAASVRRINQGATLTKSATKQLREEMCLLEDWVRIDERLIEAQTDPKRFRTGELIGCIEGLSQGFHSMAWYGGGGDIGEVTGLANRFNDLDMDNVRSAGGSGSDLSSLWIIEWGEDKTHLIYPRGAKGVGIEDEDKGKIVWQDSSGNPFDAYVNKLRMQFGIVVKRENAVQRIANIESAMTGTNDLLATATQRKLISAINYLPKAGDGAVIYVNRALKAQVDTMCFEKSNAAFNYKEVEGKRVSHFMEIPIRLQESLLETESAVTA